MADPIRIAYEVDKSQIDSADDSLRKLNDTTDEAIKETGDFNESTAGLNDQLKSVSNNFTIAGRGLGDLASGLKKSTTATAAASKGFKGLGLAMKAIPIIALVTALGSLVAFFTKTERGAQKLRVATAFLEGAIGAITDVVIGFGEKIVNAFENPQQALEDLKKQFVTIFTEFIPNAVDNVLQGFGKLGQAVKSLFAGDFEEAFNIAKEGSVQLLDGLTDLNPGTAILKQLGKEAAIVGEELVKDAEAAADLEASLNRVKVAERELSVERAQANAEIERQKLIAEDLNRTTEERAAAAQKAFQLESELLERELALQRERVRIIQEQNALGESSEEDLQAEADAKIRLAELEQTSLTRQIELNNKLNSIKAQERAEEEKERERLAQEEEKRQELLAKLREERRALLLETEELNEAERQLIIEQSEAKITGIKSEEAKKRSELQKKELELEGENLQEFGKLIGDFGSAGLAANKAIAIRQATINIEEGVTKALSAFAPPFNFIAAAAVAAAGLRNIQQIATTDTNISPVNVPQFKGKKLAKGEINIQGAGTETSDSIPAMLSRGESVMTAKETRDFLPTLTAIRKGYVDPDVLNGMSNGAPRVINASKVVEVPRDRFTLDENGFTAKVVRDSNKTVIKQNRYSW